MGKINTSAKKTPDRRMDPEVRLAGGKGAMSAKQSPEAMLRRSVMACLLWENLAYIDGQSHSDVIAELVPQVPPAIVASIAIEARLKQKLRHIPLFIANEMLKHDTHRGYVAEVLERVITRADQMTDMLALYWKAGRKPLPNQLKKGLAKAFVKFDEYQLAKYDRNDVVKMRDVMFMAHPKPENDAQVELFKRVADRTMKTPDTWEVASSSGADMNAKWAEMIDSGKLGGLAMLRNISNMKKAGVPDSKIRKGITLLGKRWLLPLNFYTAYRMNPEFARELEDAMIAMMKSIDKLKGHTVFIVDVSGSMNSGISGRSTMTRMDIGRALAVVAQEYCENITVYATAGDDYGQKHATKRVAPLRGFGLAEMIDNTDIGYGGIFTRQCLEWVKEDLKGDVVDRIIIFSDSQDCDRTTKRTPAPFGKYNYIIDVSAHRNGVNFDGVWTAEISGWSENFMEYIRAYEGLDIKTEDDMNANAGQHQPSQSEEQEKEKVS